MPHIVPPAAHILYGALLALLISFASYSLRLLTAGGSIAQFILGSVIFGLGGWAYAVPVLVFFLSSSLLTVAVTRGQTPHDDVAAKGATRDAMQVLANGGAAALAVLCSMAGSRDFWYLAYAGSLAAATADTWGTEAGIRWGGIPRLVTTWRPVEPGRSGGVTIAGTFAGLAGAILIGLSALAWAPAPRWISTGGLIVAGLGGSIIDSFIGATLQVQYRCPVCGRRTEKKTHCGGNTTILGGLRWLNNDGVNMACTITGWVIAPFAWLLAR